MKTVIVKTQLEWDNLPKSYQDHTIIEIRCESEIVIKTTPGSSTVRAYGSSTVRAYDSSTVTAYDSSTVRAYDSSTVRAYDSSTVTACNSSTVRAESNLSIITLLAFSVAFVKAKATMKISIKSKSATVIKVVEPKTVIEWLDFYGVEHSREAVLFKRVSNDLKTQEKTDNETVWSIGSVLEHSNWNPSQKECGAGKFHACHHPSACDMYRDTSGDRYVAIKVAVNDMFVWKDDPQHPNKIAFRKGTVLYECDVNGNRK